MLEKRMPRGKGDRDLYRREHALFCLGEGRPALWTSWDASLAGGGGRGLGVRRFSGVRSQGEVKRSVLVVVDSQHLQAIRKR
jgi:hypothetical protein